MQRKMIRVAAVLAVLEVALIARVRVGGVGGAAPGAGPQRRLVLRMHSRPAALPMGSTRAVGRSDRTTGAARPVGPVPTAAVAPGVRSAVCGPNRRRRAHAPAWRPLDAAAQDRLIDRLACGASARDAEACLRALGETWLPRRSILRLAVLVRDPALSGEMRGALLGIIGHTPSEAGRTALAQAVADAASRDDRAGLVLGMDALGRQRPEPASARRIGRLLAENEEPNVRSHGVRLLGRWIGTAERDGVVLRNEMRDEILQTLCADPSELVRREALAAVSGPALREDPALLGAVSRAAVQDPDPSVRARAAGLYARLGRGGEADGVEDDRF